MKISKSEKGELSCENEKVDRIVNYGGMSAVPNSPAIEFVAVYLKDGTKKEFKETWTDTPPIKHLIEQAEQYLDTI